MSRQLRFTMAERRRDLAAVSAGALETLRVTEGPFQWASLETFATALPADPVRGAASFDAAQIDDTGPADETYGALMLVAFNVPESLITDVEAWYVQEHVPLLMRVPGWLRVRRFRVRGQRGPIAWTHLAFHELRTVAALDTPERVAARSTPWRATFSSQEWFETAGRLLFERAG